MTFDQFEAYLLSEACYQNHDVSIIDHQQLQHYIKANDFIEYNALMSSHLAQGVVTIKVEQMERYWEFDDRTIHAFYNPKNGPTFPEHTDDVDVIIECKDGIKNMEVDGKEIALQPGDKLIISKGTMHKALNYEKALMASHGIGDTASLERLR